MGRVHSRGNTVDQDLQSKWPFGVGEACSLSWAGNGKALPWGRCLVWVEWILEGCCTT